MYRCASRIVGLRPTPKAVGAPAAPQRALEPPHEEKYTPALRHQIKHVSPADLATVPGLYSNALADEKS